MVEGGMEKLQKFASGKMKPKKDDDMVDRFNYYWTAAMLALFAMMIIGKQYVGQPIQCWIPAEFKGAWEKYSENYCFVENTYFVNFNESFPTDMHVHRNREIQYYQWVPFIFIAQMFLFMTPKLLWKVLKGGQAGLELGALIELASLTAKVGNDKGKDEKQKELKSNNSSAEAAKKIQQAFAFADERKNAIRNRHTNAAPYGLRLEDVKNQRSSRNRLSFYYLLFKLGNLVNSVGQLWLLNHFLGPEYKLWGYGILKDLIQGRQWQHSGHFPRVTFCDVDIREMGDRFIQHSFQCVLMINMVNEKLFIFIWFWLLALSVVNFVNLLVWAYKILIQSSGFNFIKTNLQFVVIYGQQQIDDSRLREFVAHYLCRDGVTILRLININSPGVVTAGIVHELWKGFDNAMKRDNYVVITPKQISAPLAPAGKGTNDDAQFYGGNVRFPVSSLKE